MAQQIYLDYAAATPVDSQVVGAMRPYFTEQFYNPSATYLAGRRVRQALEGARTSVAAQLGVRPAEIIFTAGATEANNLAIQGIMRQFPDGEVLVSSIEHESVLAPAKLFAGRTLEVDGNGVLKLEDLEGQVSEKTVLVSVMLVNNELGTIQPIKEVAKLLNKLSNLRRAKGNNRPLYLHTDAAQAGNYLDLHVSRLNVDLMSINGGKIYGPKQSGALYVKAGIRLEPLILGGGQEFGLRSGTENTAGCVGLAAALTTAQERHKDEAYRVSGLRRQFEKELLSAVPTAVINGRHGNRAPHILSATFPTVDNERLMMRLDEAGVQVAVGSACSASSEEPSHVLAAIGLGKSDARSTLRFSLGRETTASDLAKTTRLIKKFTLAEQ